jgi:hypothetical protein
MSRLCGLEITHTSDGNTVLSGPLRDQAELEGLLSRLFGMGIRIISFSSDNMTPGRQGKEKM